MVNRRAIMRAAAIVGLAVAASILAPSVVFAGHSDPLPADLEGLVCGLVVDLDELLVEFDQQVGNFDDDRLNRALDKARVNVVQAREKAKLPDLTGAFRDLRAAMRELEKGAAVPVSGSGFADDLASLGSFYAEVFVDDLIVLAAQLEAGTPESIAAATIHFLQGAADRNDGEWEAAVKQFTQAIRILDQELVIGSPCQ